MDAQRGITSLDKKLFEMLQKYHRPFMAVFTKIDKLPEARARKLLEEAKIELSKHPMSSPIIHITSSLSGYGVGELTANLIQMLEFPLLGLKPGKELI